MRLALRHPMAVSALFATLVFVGLVSWPFLPLDLLPNLKHPRLVIITSFGNASAEEVETLLTRKVEEAVGIVTGLRSMNSVSSEGVSSVVLKFDWGVDMSLAAVEVREKLDLVADVLPREAKLPLVVHYDPSDAPVLTIALSGLDDLTAMRVLARNVIKPKLETVAGVASVRLTGGLTPEIQVLADMGRLAAHGLDIEAVAGRLESANINFPGGKIRQGILELPVRTVGRFTTLDEIGYVPLGTGLEGGAIQVKDVAEVKRTHRDRTSICRVNGRPAVVLGIIKEPAANTLEVARRLIEGLPEVRRTLPGGMELEIVDNEASFVEEAVRDLRSNILLGGALAFVVLFVFLRSLRSSSFILLSIPVSVLCTFAFMSFAGISFNIMSISGLALGVGMLVDDSIVVLEGIDRRRRQIPDTFDAVISALREVGASVVGGTLTTLAVLVPIIFMSGLAQRLFRDFAFTLAVSQLMSLLTAMILLPSLIVRTRPPAESSSLLPSERPGGYQSVYRSVLSWALDRPRLVAGVCTLVFVVSVAGIARVGLELFPRLETGRFTMDLSFPPDSSIDRVETAVNTVEQWIREIPGVALFLTEAGSESEKGGFEPAQRIGKSNEAHISVTLNPDTPAFYDPDALIRQLRTKCEALPGVKVDFVFEKGPLARVLGEKGSPELLRAQGDDLPQLREIGDKISGMLSKQSALRDIQCEGNVWTQQLRVLVDRYRAAAKGLTVDSVARIVSSAIEGKVVGKFIQGDEETDIRVRLSTKDRTTVDELKQLPLRIGRQEDSGRDSAKQSKPQMVLLGQIANLKSDDGPREIIRSERRRSLVFRANVVGKAFSKGEEEALTAAKSVGLPDGYRVERGAGAFELSSSLRSLTSALALAILLVFVVLAIEFESLVWPLVVFASIPMTIFGPALALNSGGMPVSVLVLIGMVILAGIVVRNAILMVAYTNYLRKEGKPVKTAILDACAVRLTPILMTTLTTVFGALPVCLAWGGAAPLNRPLGITVVTGLIASTVFTLFLVPVVYQKVAEFRLGRI